MAQKGIVTIIHCWVKTAQLEQQQEHEMGKQRHK